MAANKIPECLNDEQFLDMLDKAKALGADVKACFRDILNQAKKRGIQTR